MILSVLTLTASYSSLAQTAQSALLEPATTEGGSWSLSPKRVLGDLEHHGVSFQGQLVYDLSFSWADKDAGAGFGRYSFDLMMPVDGRRLWGGSATSGMLRLKHHLSQFGDDGLGEAQLYSNIDAMERTTLYEAWLEQRLLSDRLRIKGGKIDANTEFATVQGAGDFLNSSMGYSPTIVAFPTYPEPKLGVAAFIRATAANQIGVGVFETSTSGTLSVVEPSHSWSLRGEQDPGRVSVGYWRLSGSIARLDGNTSASTQGFYSVVEQSLLHRSWDAAGERRLLGFVQFGNAEGQVSPFTRHVGGGAVLQGPFRKRSSDGIGLAATWVRFSAQPGAAAEGPSELVVESYYKMSLVKHLAVLEDFQFFHHPGGVEDRADCPVATTRLIISF